MSPSVGEHSAPLVLEGQGAEAELSPEQKRFNKLLAQVQGLQAKLRDWQAAERRFQEIWLGGLVPKRAAVASAQRELVVALDAVLTDPPVRMPARERERLLDALQHHLFELLEAGTDAELITIHDRWAQQSWQDCLRDEACDRLLRIAEAMRHTLTDAEWAEPEAAFERLRARLQTEFDAQQAEMSARQNAKAQKRAARKAPAGPKAKVQSVEQSLPELRALYRRLASALHPDRASNDTERQHRHALMQQVNAAHDAQDVLTLLQLQSQQGVGAGLAGLDEAQRMGYSQLLKAQVAVLQRQLDEAMAPMLHFRPPTVPVHRWKPEMVWAHLEELAEQLEAVTTQLRSDAAALHEAPLRKQLLKRWKQESAWM